jgi:dTDP-L-rhamnose 4-epimerase
VSVKRVLITGGAGFIGSALALRLSSDGYEVRILDSLSEQIHGHDPGQTSASFVRATSCAEMRRGSVTCREDLLSALAGVDAVVHLAAETGTGQSMYEVQRYADVNVGGTALLLDLLGRERHQVTRLVVASSRAVYGEGKYAAADGTVFFPRQRDESLLRAGRFDPMDPRNEEEALRPVPTDEDSRLAPLSVYGATKLAQENLVLTAAAGLEVNAVALRYQNVYGPGQALRNPYTGILSIFSNLLRRGEEINVFEDGLESRDFIYIDDVVEATVASLTSERAVGHPVNVGSGVSTTVLDVVVSLSAALGTTSKYSISGNFRAGDIRHNVADLARARDRLGFNPTMNFAEGMAKFAEWVLALPLTESDYGGSLAELRARNLLK